MTKWAFELSGTDPVPGYHPQRDLAICHGRGNVVLGDFLRKTG